MEATLTYDELIALRPCPSSLSRITQLLGGAKEWNGKPITAEQARNAGVTFAEIIWVTSTIARKNPDVKRKLRLWLADCAAHVLFIFEKKIKNDNRPRLAIFAARDFALGKITRAARDAAWDAARAAAGDAARAAETSWQFHRLVLWLKDKEPEQYPLDQ